MKRLSLAIVLFCCTLALAAQIKIRVNYQGAKPTISDFVDAYINFFEDLPEEEQDDSEWIGGVSLAWDNYRKGLPQEDNVTFVVDQKNGYLCWESHQDRYTVRHEMCYWNEADGKHTLFAHNIALLTDGKRMDAGQYDGLNFYRYDNAKKMMTSCDTPGFNVEYQRILYLLPRTGKDITVRRWDENGRELKQEKLKWTGQGFHY